MNASIIKEPVADIPQQRYITLLFGVEPTRQASYGQYMKSTKNKRYKANKLFISLCIERKNNRFVMKIISLSSLSDLMPIGFTVPYPWVLC